MGNVVHYAKRAAYEIGVKSDSLKFDVTLSGVGSKQLFVEFRNLHGDQARVGLYGAMTYQEVRARLMQAWRIAQIW